MGKTFEAIDDALAQFIADQPLFFVSTAPLAGGHINLSPKGLDAFRILGPRRAAYLDITGSGAETIAHVRENGRIVLMFCAFSGPAKIVRLYGHGTVHEVASAGFERLYGQFTRTPGARAIIEIAIERISDSCGWGVPVFAFQGQRDQLARWAEHKGEDALAAYRAKSNAVSIDGLPAFGASSR